MGDTTTRDMPVSTSTEGTETTGKDTQVSQTTATGVAEKPKFSHIKGSIREHCILVIRKVQIATCCQCGKEKSLGDFCPECATYVAFRLDFFKDDIIAGLGKEE